jgi:hypothetical protein
MYVCTYACMILRPHAHIHIQVLSAARVHLVKNRIKNSILGVHVARQATRLGKRAQVAGMFLVRQLVRAKVPGKASRAGAKIQWYENFCREKKTSLECMSNS